MSETIRDLIVRVKLELQQSQALTGAGKAVASQAKEAAKTAAPQAQVAQAATIERGKEIQHVQHVTRIKESGRRDEKAFMRAMFSDEERHHRVMSSLQKQNAERLASADKLRLKNEAASRQQMSMQPGMGMSAGGFGGLMKSPMGMGMALSGGIAMIKYVPDVLEGIGDDLANQGRGGKGVTSDVHRFRRSLIGLPGDVVDFGSDMVNWATGTTFDTNLGRRSRESYDEGNNRTPKRNGLVAPTEIETLDTFLNLRKKESSYLDAQRAQLANLMEWRNRLTKSHSDEIAFLQQKTALKQAEIVDARARYGDMTEPERADWLAIMKTMAPGGAGINALSKEQVEKWRSYPEAAPMIRERAIAESFRDPRFAEGMNASGLTKVVEDLMAKQVRQEDKLNEKEVDFEKRVGVKDMDQLTSKYATELSRLYQQMNDATLQKLRLELARLKGQINGNGPE